jgi:mono/diheme cytochrome c family protein
MNVWTRAILALPGLAMLAAPAIANEVAGSERPTFTKDVLPIIQENCQVCHRPGGTNLSGMVAPMSFTNYENTRPWAKAIAKQVAAKTMPPWHAAEEHAGVFENERTLEQDDIDTIVAWAKTGAARGNPADKPAPIDWPETDWAIGEPDQIFMMPEPFFVDDDVQDTYEYFPMTITEEMLPEPRWLKAVEFRAGSHVVHHIIARPFGGNAPGKDPEVFPEGVGRLLEPGTEVRWQMHYHKEPGAGTGVWDQSMIGVKYYENDEDVTHPLLGDSLGSFRFAIPPGDPAYTIEKEFTFEEDSLIVKPMPHMHLRGKSALYEAIYPDGKTEVLLNVPKYDFNWQTSYLFKDFKKMPKGSKIKLTTVFDNSEDNPYNPDPTETVRWGEPTTAEMSFGWMSFIHPEPRKRAADVSTD